MGMNDTSVLLGVGLLLVTASSVIYLALFGLYRRAVGVVDTRHRPAPSTLHFSILKPLAGDDDELDENLDSFARLEGASYELLFGVASTDDPAYDAAWRFIRRHPSVRARVFVTDPHAAENPKVAQLLGLEPRATGDVIVISDSNVRVAPDYLLALGAALEEPDTHLVSTLVRGGGERSLGGLLENTILATHVAPSVAAGFLLTDRAITIGKSMAMWRASLRVVGGLHVVKDCLAEDHVLGQIFHQAGLGVRVIPYFVENRNARCSTLRSVERHARWAKLRRTLEPAGFVFEPLLWPAATAGAVFALDRGPLSAAALLFALALQAVCGAALLRDLESAPSLPARIALEWGRTLVLAACWALAWTSRSVTWRGHRITIGRGTRIVVRGGPAAIARGEAY